MGQSIQIYCLSRPYHLKFFKGCLPQILLGPYLNTLIMPQLAKLSSLPCVLIVVLLAVLVKKTSLFILLYRVFMKDEIIFWTR